MRLRATRLSATGGHTRKRGIDIAALFAAYPGRVCCYYGTKSGPSYTDILARNREALGPESLAGGASFTLGSSTTATLDASTGQCTVYRTDVSNQSGIRFPAIVGKTYLVDVVVSTGSVYVMSGSVDQTVIATVAAGSRAAVLVVGGGAGYVSLSSVSGASVCRVISVREIVDWSKLVYSDDPTLTVPVFSVFQTSRGRGFLADSSQGLVCGPERATVTTVVAVPIGGPAFTNYTVGTVEAGKYYEIVFTVSDYSGSGSIAIVGNGGAQWEVWPAALLGNGTSRQIIKSLITGNVSLFSRATNTCTFSGISVRELPGNHMVQPTAAARGELSARYNQFEATEDLAAAYWSLSNTTALSAAVLSPRGTMTGARLESTGADTHGKTVTAPAAGAEVAFKKFVQRGNHDWVRFTFLSGANEVQAWFNLATGTVGTARGVGTGVLTSATITDAGGGWWECTLTGSIPAAASYQCLTLSAPADLNGARVSGGVRYEWGADLRLAADAIPSIPSYQRVTSATDYDEVGFPVYWRGQTDDWAKSHINPNGATKALVMWAGQKLSESATGVVVEAGADANSVSGTFRLSAPASSGAYQATFVSRGTSVAESPSVSAAYVAPARLVLRAQGGITSDTCSLTVNGTTATSATDQGTGTYTEQDVYFGARAGTSLFANIREYAPPLILFQPTSDTGLSASQITALDKAYAKAAGVSL